MTGFVKFTGQFLLVSFLVSTSADVAGAVDIKAGKKKARLCNICHGINGLATNPEAPNLAGENAFYIEKQLQAFKKGDRQHGQMSMIAKSLKDDDIKNLALWYSAMKVLVELPPTD